MMNGKASIVGEPELLFSYGRHTPWFNAAETNIGQPLVIHREQFQQLVERQLQQWQHLEQQQVQQ